MARLKLAELTSGIGALVLGVGLGALLGRYLAGLGVLVLLAGLLLHAWGMCDKHRLEAGRSVEPWWATVLYWICWLALGALVIYFVMRLRR